MPDSSQLKPSLPLLAVISSISSFSLAIVVPALPTLAHEFATDAAGVQFLISGYLLGLAVAQPLWGPLADRLGRRRIALLGFGLFVMSSLACLVATDLLSLSLLRMLQAAGGSAGTVAARAMIYDSFDAKDSASAMSWITIGLGTAPIIAPIVGGVIIGVAGHDALFMTMAIMGGTLWVLIFVALQETLQLDQEPLNWRGIFLGYKKLLSHRGFVANTAVYGLVQGAFFAFLSVGAAVFQDSFGIGPTQFGAVWGAMSIAFVLGAVVAGKLAKTAWQPYLLPVTVIGTLLFGQLTLVNQLVFGATLPGLLVPLGLLMTLAGGITPIVMAGAVYQVPHLAGTAAGLSSAIGMTVGGSFTSFAGLLYVGSFTPIAALIACTTVLTFAAWLWARPYHEVMPK